MKKSCYCHQLPNGSVWGFSGCPFRVLNNIQDRRSLPTAIAGETCRMALRRSRRGPA